MEMMEWYAKGEEGALEMTHNLKELQNFLQKNFRRADLTIKKEIKGNRL